MIDKICSDWIGLLKSKLREDNGHVIGQLTGFNNVEHAYSLSAKTVEGIICCWNPSLFITYDRSSFPRFVVIKAHWRYCDDLVRIICVYALNNLLDRIKCFDLRVSFI